MSASSEDYNLGRKRVERSRKGEYMLCDGRVLLLTPPRKPVTLSVRAIDGRETLLVKAEGDVKSLSDIDVHRDAGTAVLRAYDRNGESIFYLFDGHTLAKIDSTGHDEAWSDFVISPEGARVAFAVINVDETGAHVRIYDLIKKKELQRIRQKDDSLIALDLAWKTDSILRYNSYDDDGGRRRFRMNLRTGEIASR